MKLSKNKKGFTLVELLLVMAIIGILAGIIFISIGSARKRARVTTFKQQMKNIAVAATQCTDVGGAIQLTSGEDLCDKSTGIGQVPEIKQCDGTSGFVAMTAGDGGLSGDDFEIDAFCTISGTAVVCDAKCTSNGCIFDDPSIPEANDGCPETSH
jgi:prepilin-type N-terminal cleavage/methylation domain-containing protein